MTLSDAPSDDDRCLVRAAAQGDRIARRTLFERHGNAVASLIRRTFGPDADVEDGLQQTFLVAFETLGSLRDGGAVRPWLLRIALRTCRRMWWTKRMRELLVPPSAADASPMWEAEDLRADLSADDRAELVLLGRRVNLLPIALRQVVVVRHAFGHTIEETAVICGCSTATVSRRLAEAERRLRGDST